MKKRKDEKFNKGQIIIYKQKGGGIELKVKFQGETVWLSLSQIASLFERDKSVISRHLRNIFKEKELDKKSVVAKIATTALDGKIYQVEFFNLDVIISIGYRVNSSRATQFRIWANKILKDYLLKGYVVNQKRLLEANDKFSQLKNTIDFINKKSRKNLLKGQEKELLDLLSDYSKTLTLLEKYDKDKLQKEKGEKSIFVLQYNTCLDIIYKLKDNLIIKKEASDLFGYENNHKLEAIINNLYQSFSGEELYKSIEEKRS
jgi:hypothetical protein